MIRFILPDKYKENLIQVDKSFCFCLFSSVKKQTIILQNSFHRLELDGKDNSHSENKV